MLAAKWTQKSIITPIAPFTKMAELCWISNCIHYEVWDKIIYPFKNFNGATVEV